MLTFEIIAERKIAEAAAKGEFDDLQCRVRAARGGGVGEGDDDGESGDDTGAQLEGVTMSALVAGTEKTASGCFGSASSQAWYLARMAARRFASRLP